MNVKPERVTAFVDALQQVELHECGIDMMSVEQPTCDTPGCHAGLIYRASPLLPPEFEETDDVYMYDLVVDDLARFLMDDSGAKMGHLEKFAECNPNWWGNLEGGQMFGDGAAFDQPTNEFPESVIVDHWGDVESRNHLLATATEV